MREKKLFWRINHDIRAPELRVINEDGTQVGILSRVKALELAQEKGRDLVEIAPKANPPVAKVIEFGKFRYREEKKLRAERKKSKVSELKEIRFSPFIAEGDFQVRQRRIEEFLNEGYKVKLVVVFKKRQLASKKFGYDILKRIVEELGGRVATDMDAKFLGRHLIMIVSPLKKVKEDGKNEK